MNGSEQAAAPPPKPSGGDAPAGAGAGPGLASSWLNGLSLRTRLLLAWMPLAVALAGLAILSIWSVHYQSQLSQAILKDNYRSVLAAQRMKESIERIDSSTLYRLTGSPTQGEPDLARHRPRFESELQMEESNITEKGEEEAAITLRNAWQNYQVLLDKNLSLTGEAARLHYFQSLLPAFDAVRFAADEVLSLNQDAMLRRSEHATQLGKQIESVLIGVSLLILGLGWWISSSLTTRIVRPVSVLSQTARRLGQGDLEVRAVLSGRDELGVLAQEFNAMADHLLQYRRSSLGQLLRAQLASQSAIDSIPDPVVIFDLEGHILNVNRAAERLLFIRANAEGQEAMTKVPLAVKEKLLHVFRHVVRGEGAYVPRGFDDAVPCPSPEGERYLLPRAEPVYREQEGVVGATVILQDVTRLRRFDELKNDLVATVAHEFRTPLTSLRMAIHLCLEELAGPLTEKQTELMDSAREDCERLQRIVDDLLDLARMQSGKMELHPITEAPEVLVERALEQWSAAAMARQIELTTEVAPFLPEVLVDEERIAIVFANLISNAIRHTPAGGRIRVSAALSADFPGMVRFEVKDTGEGIPSALQAAVFERFQQGDGARVGKVGLGLSICREIVRAHRGPEPTRSVEGKLTSARTQGEIGLISAEGEGACFWFVLPQSTPQASA